MKVFIFAVLLAVANAGALVQEAGPTEADQPQNPNVQLAGPTVDDQLGQPIGQAAGPSPADQPAGPSVADQPGNSLGQADGPSEDETNKANAERQHKNNVRALYYGAGAGTAPYYGVPGTEVKGVHNDGRYYGPGYGHHGVYNGAYHGGYHGGYYAGHAGYGPVHGGYYYPHH